MPAPCRHSSTHVSAFHGVSDRASELCHATRQCIHGVKSELCRHVSCDGIGHGTVSARVSRFRYRVMECHGVSVAVSWHVSDPCQQRFSRFTACHAVPERVTGVSALCTRAENRSSGGAGQGSVRFVAERTLLSQISPVNHLKSGSAGRWVLRASRRR